MARSPRFARPFGWLRVVSLVPLVLFAGCRSDSGSRSGGTNPYDPLSPQVQSSSAAVDPSTAPPANHGDAVAATTSPSSAPPAQGLYGGQKTCPVTGEPLGGMGPAIPVTVKGQTIYVCCRGCVAKVQRDPDTYLRKVEAERGKRSQGAFSPNNSYSSYSRSNSGGGCCGGGGVGCCH